jgi:hypothetical protein
VSSPTARRRRCRLGVIVALTSLIAASSAGAAQVARLHVALVPERLGQGTTIEFGFQIAATGGGVPAPARRIELRYPAHVGIVTSGLGVASCTQAVLEELGQLGCPSRSLMGYGEATGEAEIGDEILQEAGDTAVFMAPLANESINVAFYVNGENPLEDRLIFPGLLLPASPPYGGNLEISVPLLATYPEGPDIALVKLRSTIGPLGVTYYERIHHEFVPYRPSGIILPSLCPSGGFPFAVTVTFANGTTTTSKTRVGCPAHRRPSRRDLAAPGASR